MQRFRGLLQVCGVILIFTTIFGFLPYTIGLPLALAASLILDFTYVFEYYRKGETKMARRYIYFMIIFLALLLLMMK